MIFILSCLTAVYNTQKVGLPRFSILNQLLSISKLFDMVLPTTTWLVSLRNILHVIKYPLNLPFLFNGGSHDTLSSVDEIGTKLTFLGLLAAKLLLKVK